MMTYFASFFIDEWTVLNESNMKKKSKKNTKESLNSLLFSSPYGMETAEEPVAAGSGSASYVNLLVNPERFTGYSGPSARRVWRSIQEENCFGEASDVCLEKRIFYRYCGLGMSEHMWLWIDVFDTFFDELLVW